MGTNTLPFLVRWIQYERPAWRQHLYEVSWNLPQNFQYSGTISHLLTLGDKRHRADIAADAFLILKRRGRPAAPELKRLAVQFPMTETNGRALWCLECIKSDDWCSFY